MADNVGKPGGPPLKRPVQGITTPGAAGPAKAIGTVIRPPGSAPAGARAALPPLGGPGRTPANQSIISDDSMPVMTAPSGGKVPVDQLKGRKIGRVLIKMALINRHQLQDALDIQIKEKRGPIGQILVELGYINESQLKIALAAKDGMDSVKLVDIEIEPAVIEKLSAMMANTFKVLPFKFDEATNTLHVAVDSPHNFDAIDGIRKLMNYRVEAYIADADELTTALQRFYPENATEDMKALMDELSADAELGILKDGKESIDLDELKTLADSNPVKKLLNLVLLQAIRDHASDIHFEPFETEFKMRYRIDGVLYEMVPPPRHIALAISSRIKVMANLDIAERRLPQDGRIELVVSGNPVDLRVSVLPTMFGESVVMRVLDRSNIQLDMDRIGLRQDELRAMQILVGKPNGIVIVTGPTGSGKTTTLYAALNYLNDVETKLITTEDPVEYDIDGLVQCQMNEDIGLTFARCLRSILRQDPDIILVGEVRDLETAQIAVQASLTGHLVFTTLHTNDAPSAIARLLDLGLEAFLITATLEGIVGQRLVRRICSGCKIPYTPTEEQLMELNLRPADIAGKQLYTGKGCDKCTNIGYKGRMAIFEIMSFDDSMRDLIMKGASANVLRQEARKRGMRTLRESGLLAIYEGLTTLEEVVKETVLDES